VGKVIIQHVDDAPFHRGERKGSGPITRASQLIGDNGDGPWIFVQSIEAGVVAPAHSHTQNEVIYIIDGWVTVGRKRLGPGSVLYVEKDTPYRFTVGEEGVRFLNVRPGPSVMVVAGAVRQEYP